MPSDNADLFARKWLPREFQDEVIPEPLADPSGWLARREDGSWCLRDPNKLGFADVDVLEGATVFLDWTVRCGIWTLSIAADRSYKLDEPLPELEGGIIHFCVFDEPEIGGCDLTQLVADQIDAFGEGELPCEIDLLVYAWSAESYSFVLRDGRLVPASKATADA